MGKPLSLADRIERRKQGLREISLDGNISKRPFADALRVALMKTKGDRFQLARVAEALVRRAARGDVNAIKEIADRIDGRVPTALNIGTEDGVISSGIAVMFVSGPQPTPDLTRLIDNETDDE